MTTDAYLQRTEVSIERVFDAPPSRIYQAWTDPETMARWMWAGLGEKAWAENDVRVGGAYRVYASCDGGRHQGAGWSGMCGLYVELVPDEKVVFTLHWDADVGYNQGEQLALDEVIAVTLAAEGAGTRMTCVHMGIPDDGASAGGHRAGLSASFDLLATIVAA